MNEVFDPAARRQHEREMIKNICHCPWETAVPPIQVAPHVYYAGNQWVGAFWIDTGEGLILLDAGMPFQLHLIFEGMRCMGFDPRQIKKVLLSHAHYDHCGALRAVLEYTKAECYAAKEDAQELMNPVNLLNYGEDYQKVYPDHFYEAGHCIELGNICIEPVVVGGHTPGTTCFFFEDVDDSGKTYSIGVHGGLGLSALADCYFENAEDAFRERSKYRKGQERVIDRTIDIPLSFHMYNLKTLEKAKETWRGAIDPCGWKNMLTARLDNLKDVEENSIFKKKEGM